MSLVAQGDVRMPSLDFRLRTDLPACRAAAPWQRIDLNQIDRDDVTLDEIDVAHDDFIMVEPRNPDGGAALLAPLSASDTWADSWPTGAPNSPPVVHRARFEVGGAVELWLPPQGWLTAKIVAVNDDVGGMVSEKARVHSTVL